MLQVDFLKNYRDKWQKFIFVSLIIGILYQFLALIHLNQLPFFFWLQVINDTIISIFIVFISMVVCYLVYSFSNILSHKIKERIFWLIAILLIIVLLKNIFLETETNLWMSGMIYVNLCFYSRYIIQYFNKIGVFFVI